MSNTLIYYVYAYLSEDDTPYYIGKGKDKRAYDKRHSVPIPNDISKIVFLEANLSEYDALSLEAQFITQWGRKDLGTGILLNRTDGGGGVSGYKHTEEAKHKISISTKGIAKPQSESHRENNRKSKLGKKYAPRSDKGKSRPNTSITMTGKKRGPYKKKL